MPGKTSFRANRRPQWPRERSGTKKRTGHIAGASFDGVHHCLDEQLLLRIALPDRWIERRLFEEFFGDRPAENPVATRSCSKCFFQKDFWYFPAVSIRPAPGTDGIAIDLTVNTLTVH